MSKTINKDGIIEYLQTQNVFADATKKETKEFVEDFFAFIQEAVVAGDTVSVPGFGKFEAYTSTTSDKTSPKFRPFKDFKDAVAA